MSSIRKISEPPLPIKKPKKNEYLYPTDMGIFQNQHLRIRRRICHAVANQARNCRERPDFRTHVHRHCCHIADDTGTIGINTATYIGYTAAGGSVIGSVITTPAVILPSFLLVLYANRFVRRHKESIVIKSIFAGLRPVVVGLIGSAALLLMNRENFDELYSSVTICAVAFVFGIFLQSPPHSDYRHGGYHRIYHILTRQ